jgi:hypothetical protein
VRRSASGIEQRIRSPHVVHIVDAERRMLEKMHSLAVDLEGVIVLQQVDVE